MMRHGLAYMMHRIPGKLSQTSQCICTPTLEPWLEVTKNKSSIKMNPQVVNPSSNGMYLGSNLLTKKRSIELWNLS